MDLTLTTKLRWTQRIAAAAAITLLIWGLVWTAYGLVPGVTPIQPAQLQLPSLASLLTTLTRWPAAAASTCFLLAWLLARGASLTAGRRPAGPLLFELIGGLLFASAMLSWIVWLATLVVAEPPDPWRAAPWAYKLTGLALGSALSGIAAAATAFITWSSHRLRRGLERERFLRTGTQE